MRVRTSWPTISRRTCSARRRSVTSCVAPQIAVISSALVGEHDTTRRGVAYVTVIPPDDPHVERERARAYLTASVTPAAGTGRGRRGARTRRSRRRPVGGMRPPLHAADAVELVGPLEPVGREVVPPAADQGQLLCNDKTLTASWISRSSAARSLTSRTTRTMRSGRAARLGSTPWSHCSAPAEVAGSASSSTKGCPVSTTRRTVRRSSGSPATPRWESADHELGPVASEVTGRHGIRYSISKSTISPDGSRTRGRSRRRRASVSNAPTKRWSSGELGDLLWTRGPPRR